MGDLKLENKSQRQEEPKSLMKKKALLCSPEVSLYRKKSGVCVVGVPLFNFVILFGNKEMDMASWATSKSKPEQPSQAP